MRSLVTGGAGFIGSHIVEELLQRGDQVRVLDDFSTGTRRNLDLLHGKIEIIEGDLRDPQVVGTAVRGIDRVFHLAAFISVPQSIREPEICFQVNVAGTVSLLEKARQAGVQKVVLASSTAVYGDPQDFPTSEKSPLMPLSPYAVSKQINEIYASHYSQVFGLPVVALRFFNVYGPRQRPDSPYAAAIPIFISRLVSGKPITIFGDGKQSRDFIFVKDVVKASLLAAESDISGQIFNVCTGHETDMLSLLEELSEISPQSPQVQFEAVRPGDIYRSLGNPEKAAHDMGFRAETSLAEGLAQTFDWMKE